MPFQKHEDNFMTDEKTGRLQIAENSIYVAL